MSRAVIVGSLLALTFALGGSCGGGGSGTGGGAGGGSGGGSGGGGGGGTTLDCPGLVTCAGNCTQTDQACLNACGAQASSTAITQYNALVDCMNTNSCTTTQCLQMNCGAELNACIGSSGTGGGAGGAGGGSGGGGGGSGGTTTSGKCQLSSYCWDYTLTVTTNHNDGVEHYVYYDASLTSSGQSACMNSTFSAQQPGPWDNAAISARNLTQKKTACSLAGGTFTEGAACSLSGSLGHCTNDITNVWDGTTLTATTTAAWSVP